MILWLEEYNRGRLSLRILNHYFVLVFSNPSIVLSPCNLIGTYLSFRRVKFRRAFVWVDKSCCFGMIAFESKFLFVKAILAIVEDATVLAYPNKFRVFVHQTVIDNTIVRIRKVGWFRIRNARWSAILSKPESETKTFHPRLEMSQENLITMATHTETTSSSVIPSKSRGKVCWFDYFHSSGTESRKQLHLKR